MADSLCGALGGFAAHRFVVVLSSRMRATRERMAGAANVEVYEYDVRNDWRTLLLGRDRFLDGLVREKGVDAVLTVFGPSRWDPQCLHISGFASAQLVLTDSPYQCMPLSFTKRLKENIRNRILLHYYRRSTKLFFTENPYISRRLERLLPGARVATVTNYYNQVYDHPERWQRRELPPFPLKLPRLSRHFPSSAFWSPASASSICLSRSSLRLLICVFTASSNASERCCAKAFELPRINFRLSGTLSLA